MKEGVTWGHRYLAQIEVKVGSAQALGLKKKKQNQHNLTRDIFDFFFYLLPWCNVNVDRIFKE